MKKLLVLGVVSILCVPAIALAHNQDKVYLCHKTGSESNPWIVQVVNANEVQSHLDNGDKLYKGPLKDNGHPDPQEGKKWCVDQDKPETPPVIPTVTETSPPVTPPVTPSVTVVTPTTPVQTVDGTFKGK